MKTQRPSDQESESEPLTPEQEATVKATGLWVNHFARTLKTCRLYDGSNPTVVRFRLEVANALTQLLEAHGSISLTFTADDVLCEGASVYAAKHRDDNLAFAFYRDGVRTLTFREGFEARELDQVLDAVLLVTGQNLDHNDLVTLLWEAHLPHLDLDYVPGAPDMGSGGGAEPGEGGALWPTAGYDDAAADASALSEPEFMDVSAETAVSTARSDDWSVGEFTAEIEAGFEELQALAPAEVERFQKEFMEEHEASIVTAAADLMRVYLKAGLAPDDRLEVERFLPRLLRQAFAQGEWRDAGGIIDLLGEMGGSEWSMPSFTQELLQPISVGAIRTQLEHQEIEDVADFVALARRLGEISVDLIHLILAETQSAKHQRVLNDALVDLCRDNPERLAPLLSDPRAPVVLSTTKILAAIGGDAIVGLLQPLIDHPDPRVRTEVVVALKKATPRLARPLLIDMLPTADSRTFCSLLHHIGLERDPGTARMLLDFLLEEEFEKRPPEEKRAIYSALGSAGGDEVLAELEAELHKGNWFQRGNEDHRHAVARCMARIGTALAREILERGTQSKRGPVRKAAEEGIVRFGKHE